MFNLQCKSGLVGLPGQAQCAKVSDSSAVSRPSGPERDLRGFQPQPRSRPLGRGEGGDRGRLGVRLQLQHSARPDWCLLRARPERECRRRWRRSPRGRARTKRRQRRRGWRRQRPTRRSRHALGRSWSRRRRFHGRSRGRHSSRQDRRGRQDLARPGIQSILGGKKSLKNYRKFVLSHCCKRFSHTSAKVHDESLKNQGYYAASLKAKLTVLTVGSLVLFDVLIFVRTHRNNLVIRTKSCQKIEQREKQKGCK